jgi:hypothetical protein
MILRCIKRWQRPGSGIPDDLAALRRYRLIIDNFRDDMSAATQRGPIRQKAEAPSKDNNKGFLETPPEGEACRYHDESSSALRLAPELRV